MPVAATAADQVRPAILRFATDDFMEQMLGTLARDPSRLDRLIARPETWRTPMAEPADLIERIPIPRIAQRTVRATLARQAKPSIATTVAETARTEQAQTRLLPLKLYQPAHQRFYVVAGSLVCGIHGLPDHAVPPGGAEQINFVIRRLLPATPGSSDVGELREFAYVKNGRGARWQRVASGPDADRFVAGEELLPVFPLGYQDQLEHPRTLWGGLVPVGRREEYIGASVDRSVAPALAAGQQAALGVVEPTAATSKLARLAQFQAEVAEPWKNLIRTSFAAAAALAEGSPFGSDYAESATTKRTRVFEANLQQQHGSWLTLLDFADYLAAHLPDVWSAVDGVGAPASLSTQRKALYDWLGTATMSAALKTALKPTDASPAVPSPAQNLRDALKAIRVPAVRQKLESTELSYTSAPASQNSTDWPPFRFVLAGVNTGHTADGPFVALGTLAAASATDVEPGPVTSATAVQQAAEVAAAKVDRLTALLGRALEATDETAAPPLPFALQLKNALSANGSDGGWFVARFVHTRRDCGPLHEPGLSPPTQRFQLANFFDPDAPARPVRVTLPLDTSPAGLRKFHKNTAFVISDMLCGQIQRAKGLGLIDLIRAVLPFPLHKDLDVGGGGSCSNGTISIGMICSLSIPIITICALILLIIFVSLLDLVFRWLPFFVLCFPVPKLRGKAGAA